MAGPSAGANGAAGVARQAAGSLSAAHGCSTISAGRTGLASHIWHLGLETKLRCPQERCPRPHLHIRTRTLVSPKAFRKVSAVASSKFSSASFDFAGGSICFRNVLLRRRPLGICATAQVGCRSAYRTAI